MTGKPPASPPDRKIYSVPRPQWLALYEEEVLDPGRPIVDAHHHLWDRPGERYLTEDALADMTSSHNIVASVYVECHSMYREQGPDALRPVGEVDFAREAGLSNGTSRPALCAAIVGHADLTLGSAAREVLEAEIDAGDGRFRGIRHSAAYDPDPAVAAIYPMRRKGLMSESKFREGFACLAPLDLGFDAWLFQSQIDELFDLARSFPGTRVVLNHCGGPIGVGAYAKDPQATFRAWREAIARLARMPNVHVKLGGLAIRLLGHHFEQLPTPPSSQELATTWKPYVETCVEAFGPDRCMFESNFPPDKGQCSYRTLFNAFKRIAAQYGETEQTALFSGTASAFYRLEIT